MTPIRLPVAYMPLVDAAPLIVANEMGFAEDHGLALDLIPAPSWSSARDMLAFGRVDAAHLLSPVPVALALGLGGVASALSAIMVLSVNGNVVGVSRTLEKRLRDDGHAFACDDAASAGAALARAAQGGLTVGVPFPFSMHVELLHVWFDQTPLAGSDITIRTIPPPLMAEALSTGEIDVFCVGEPWGSVAVEAGYGALLLTGKSIWSFAPEKVLAVRTDWAETEPHLVERLMQALWKAGRWLALPESRTAAAEVLARREYLGVPSELIDRAFTGRLTINSQGDQRHFEGLLEFHRGAANFPWRSQAKWMGHQMALRHGLDPKWAEAQAARAFRSDIYRAAISPVGADLPGASEKLEGTVAHPTAVASASGRMILEPDLFFDGRIFEPIPE